MEDFKYINELIVEELIDLGLPIEGKSFLYWGYILTKIYNHEIEKYSVINIYKDVAKKFDTNIYAAERALRNGTTKMKNRIQEKYKIKTKITNGTVVALFQLKVF